MFKFQKEKCTSVTIGTVIKLRWDGEIWFLKAEYVVNGKSYVKTEQLRYKKQKTYKLGNIPIGMKSKASLGELDVGDSVRIKYNPQKPKKAYMPDNTGMLLS